MEKPELIARVNEHHDVFDSMLIDLSEATSDAKMLADIIEAAEARLTCALANVESGGQYERQCRPSSGP